jgi:hypothetical protein
LEGIDDYINDHLSVSWDAKQDHIVWFTGLITFCCYGITIRSPVTPIYINAVSWFYKKTMNSKIRYWYCSSAGAIPGVTGRYSFYETVEFCIDLILRIIPAVMISRRFMYC